MLSVFGTHRCHRGGLTGREAPRTGSALLDDRDLGGGTAGDSGTYLTLAQVPGQAQQRNPQEKSAGTA